MSSLALAAAGIPPSEFRAKSTGKNKQYNKRNKSTCPEWKERSRGGHSSSTHLMREQPSPIQSSVGSTGYSEPSDSNLIA